MKPFLAVLTRELRILFGTPLAWGALGAFSLVTALLFWLELLSFEVAQQRAMAVNDPSVLSLLDFNDLLFGSVLVHSQILLIFVVPLLTMRLFADETRQGTMELLLSAPVRTSHVVLGKISGVFVILGLMGAVLLLYPALLQVFGRAAVQGDGVVDWGQALLGVTGVVACGALYASIGAAISAGTKSPSVAALVTGLSLVGVWFGASTASGAEGLAGPVLSWMGPGQHMERMARGILALPDVVYFASGVVAFTFIAHRLVENGRRA